MGKESGKIRGLGLCLGLCLCIHFGVLPKAICGERMHLSDLITQLKSKDKITAAYKDNFFASHESADKKEKNKSAQKKHLKSLNQLLKKNSKVREKFLTEFRQSTPFVRGEIEDTETLNSVMALLQLSILEMRQYFVKSEWNKAQFEAEAWFNFAADLAYEESTNIGLKAAAVIRTFLLDEYESAVVNHGVDLAKTPHFREWLQKIRAPWPIDRVIVSEAKRALAPALMPTAEKVAKNLQLSPYQTAAEALEKIPGAKPKDLDYLKELWKNEDIGRMKEEITRIGRLKLKIASLEFSRQYKKSPSSAEELVKERLLDRVPIDYNTGKPMEISGAQ